MPVSPDKKNYPSNNKKEHGCLRKFIYIFLISALLFMASIEEIKEVDTNIYPPNQTEFVIEIPEGVNRETQSLLIAQRLAADMEVSTEDLLPEGGYGVIAQVTYNISEDKIAELYQQIELDDNPHHLAILSYLMFKDNGAQAVNIAIGNRIIIGLNDIVLNTLDIITPTINLTKEHFNDVETIAFILTEVEPGVMIIEKVLIDHHEILTVYEPEALRTTGDPARLVFVMSRGKHAVYPSVESCESEIPSWNGIIGFSTDVCDPDQVVQYRISSEDMVGEPDNSINPIINNPDFSLFPKDPEYRRDMLRPDLSFFIDD